MPRASNGRPSSRAATSTSPPASARRMAVDETGSSMPSARATSGSGTTSKPASLAEPAQQRRRCRAAGSRSGSPRRPPPIGPRGSRPGPPARTAPATRAARSSSKCTTAVMSTPVAASSSSFWSRSVSSCGADSGRTTIAGWRSKVTTAERAPMSAASALDVGDDRLVPEMHAVVRADGDDAALRGAVTPPEIAHHLHDLHARGCVSGDRLAGGSAVSRGRRR